MDSVSSKQSAHLALTDGQYSVRTILERQGALSAPLRQLDRTARQDSLGSSPDIELGSPVASELQLPFPAHRRQRNDWQPCTKRRATTESRCSHQSGAQRRLHLEHLFLPRGNTGIRLDPELVHG